MLPAGHWHNASIALYSIPGTKAGGMVILMVDFKDRVDRNTLWKVPEHMDIVLLVCRVSMPMFGA